MADETKEAQDKAHEDPAEASADRRDPNAEPDATPSEGEARPETLETPEAPEGSDDAEAPPPDEQDEPDASSESIAGLDEGLRAIEDEASGAREAPEAEGADAPEATTEQTEAPPADDAAAEPGSDADALPPLDLPEDFGDLDDALRLGDEFGGGTPPEPLAPEPLPPTPPAPAAAEEEEAEEDGEFDAAESSVDSQAPAAAPERRGPSWPVLIGAAVALSIVVAAVTAVVVRELVVPAPTPTPGIPGVARMGPIESEQFWQEGAIARARLVADSPIAPRRFYEIFTDFEHWDEFMPGVTAAAAIEPEIEAPMGTNRVRLKIREHDPVLAREIAAELEFTLDPTSEVVMRTLEHPYGRVREIWRIRRVEGQAGAQIEYERFARTTTDLPDFLDRARVRRHFLDVLDAVAARAGGGAAVAAP